MPQLWLKFSNYKHFIANRRVVLSGHLQSIEFELASYVRRCVPYYFHMLPQFLYKVARFLRVCLVSWLRPTRPMGCKAHQYGWRVCPPSQAVLMQKISNGEAPYIGCPDSRGDEKLASSTLTYAWHPCNQTCFVFCLAWLYSTKWPNS